MGKGRLYGAQILQARFLLSVPTTSSFTRRFHGRKKRRKKHEIVVFPFPALFVRKLLPRKVCESQRGDSAPLSLTREWVTQGKIFSGAYTHQVGTHTHTYVNVVVRELARQASPHSLTLERGSNSVFTPVRKLRRRVRLSLSTRKGQKMLYQMSKIRQIFQCLDCRINASNVALL